VLLPGIRLDNLAVCEHVIRTDGNLSEMGASITAKEFFEVNEKAILAWLTPVQKNYPVPPPPPPAPPPMVVQAEADSEEFDEGRYSIDATASVISEEGAKALMAAGAIAEGDMCHAHTTTIDHARAAANWHRTEPVKTTATIVKHWELQMAHKKPKAQVAHPIGAQPTIAGLASSSLYHSEEAAAAGAAMGATLESSSHLTPTASAKGIVEDHGITLGSEEVDTDGDAALARMLQEEEDAAYAAMQRHASEPLPLEGSEWEVIYAAGVAYRHTLSFNDKSDKHGPEFGEMVTAHHVVRSSEGLIYIKPEGIDSWLPTMSPTGIKILREVKEDSTISPWRPAKDVHSGGTYYFNTETKETTWERPPGYHDPPPPPPQRNEGQPPQGKVMVTFKVPMTWRPGQNCLVDVPGGASQLVAVAKGIKPGQTVKVAVSDPQYKAPPEAECQQGEHSDDWIAITDPSTGRDYFYNVKTQQTSWVKPSGYHSPPGLPVQHHPSANQTSDKIWISFEVPHNWRPGQYCNIRKPDGTMAMVAVAKDVKPGQTVKVNV